MGLSSEKPTAALVLSLIGPLPALLVVPIILTLVDMILLIASPTMT
jgi:hypothetical protein